MFGKSLFGKSLFGKSLSGFGKSLSGFGKSFRKTIVVGSFLTMALVGSAVAQTPTRLNQFDAWGAYSYKSGNTTICYVLSAPISSEPTNVNHGDNFFLISKRAGEALSFEPQFMAGYALQVDSKVVVNVDGKDFDFFTKDVSAWLASPSAESQLVTAMRKGAQLNVKATSKRGTKTSYNFSLKGVTAALNSTQNCN